MKRSIVIVLMIIVLLIGIFIYLNIKSPGITWSSQVDNKTWTDATSFCTNLGSGWRLPTRFELVDALTDQFAFDNTKSSGGFQEKTLYWSSSETDYSDNKVGVLNIPGTSGPANMPINKNLPHSFRCVK